MAYKEDQDTDKLCEKTEILHIKPAETDLENYFYVLGGIKNKNSFCDYIYINKVKKWIPLPSCDRTYLSCAVIDKKMYLVGGRVDSVPQNTVAVFANKTWQIMPCKLSEKRSESGIAVLDNKIYIIGGFNKADRLIEVYDVENYTSKIISSNLQQARYGHCVVVLDKTIYVLGGHRFNQYFNSMEKYMSNRERRLKLCDGMNRRRAYFAAIAIPPYIFAFGGCGGVTNSNEIRRLDSAERYDSRSDEWTLIANMPSARSNMTAVKWGKRILLIGGLDDKKNKLKEILMYDPEKNTYEKFRTQLPEWRFSHCSASE